MTDSTSKALVAEIASSPPSMNSMYRPNKWGRLVLSAEGKRYKRRVQNTLHEQWTLTASGFFDKEKAYELGIVVVMESDKIYNKGWPTKAKARFKRVDVSNLVKIVEDAVSEFAQLDDSHNFRVVVQKTPALEDEEPCVIVWLRPMDPERVPEFLTDLLEDEWQENPR